MNLLLADAQTVDYRSLSQKVRLLSCGARCIVLHVEGTGFQSSLITQIETAQVLGENKLRSIFAVYRFINSRKETRNFNRGRNYAT